MRSSNPALSDKAFRGLTRTAEDRMTIGGTVNKTALLLAILIVCASWPWRRFWEAQDPTTIYPIMLIGSLGGFAVAMVTIFKKEWSPITAPIYAGLKGLALGAISAFFEMRYPGIVIQAVMLTFAVLLSLLMAYKSGMIKVTQNFRLGLFAATGGIMLLYLFSFVGSFFGLRIPFIHGSGLMGIGFSVFVVVIAALNLVLDFDFIERGADRGAPKFMEWYGAFGLMVTLVWLYIEILRLLGKLRGRD